LQRDRRALAHARRPRRVGLLRARAGDRPRPRPRRRDDARAAVAARAPRRRRPRPLGPRARGGEHRVNLEAARGQFPVLARYAYLNAGTFGPLARATAEAVEAVQRADLERGRAGREYFEQMQAVRAAARAALAGDLGVAPEQVALTTSTTDAVNTVLAG